MAYRKNIFKNIKQINNFINKTYCKKTENDLSDTNLVKHYRNTPSSKNKISILKKQLKNLRFKVKDINRIVNNELILNEFCTPPGTKGAIRGNHFNNIVKNKILEIADKIPNKENYDVQFEKKVEFSPEIPDWFIKQKDNNKILIGMNQVDLWSGGQQTNRGSKYILNEDLHKNPNYKVISVVSKYIQLESYNNKAYNILKKGFEENRLCYLCNLENIIKKYFDIK